MSFAYLPLFTGDYLRDTRHLSPQRHGIYLLFLIYCWDQQGPLPLDEQDCAGIANCRSSDEIDALRYVLTKYFIKMDDGYYNQRMQKEVEKSGNISHKRSVAGKLGYQARSNKLPGKSQANAKHVHLSLSSSPSLTPTSTPDQKTSSVPLPAWLGPETWKLWEEHRRAKRAKMTPKAVELLLRKLTQFRERGMDPKAVIEQSIANGWTGLFELQPGNTKTQSGIEEWLSRQTTPEEEEK